MNDKKVGRWTLARVLFVVGAIGGGAAGDGCSCDDDGPYVDNNGALHCGPECDQWAYACAGADPVCAPDDYTAGIVYGCQWTDKINCGIGGDTGADGAEADVDDGGDAEVDSGVDSSGGDQLCDDWDPDPYVTYNRRTNRYEIDQALVDDLNTNPLPLTECDEARFRLLSGGYWEIVDIGQDDLVRHLGFTEHDSIRSVNGYDLQTAQDVEDAWLDLRDETLFTVVVLRSGTVLTRSYEIVP